MSLYFELNIETCKLFGRLIFDNNISFNSSLLEIEETWLQVCGYGYKCITKDTVALLIASSADHHVMM